MLRDINTMVQRVICNNPLLSQLQKRVLSDITINIRLLLVNTGNKEEGNAIIGLIVYDSKQNLIS